MIRADKVKFTTIALGCEDHRPFNVTIFFYLFFILWLRPRAQLLIIMPDSQNWTIFTPWLKKSPERSLDNKQIHCSTSRLICMAKYSTIFKHSTQLCLKISFFFSTQTCDSAFAFEAKYSCNDKKHTSAHMGGANE